MEVLVGQLAESEFEPLGKPTDNSTGGSRILVRLLVPHSKIVEFLSENGWNPQKTS
jgi:hypothetical protein